MVLIKDCGTTSKWQNDKSVYLLHNYLCQKKKKKKLRLTDQDYCTVGVDSITATDDGCEVMKRDARKHSNYERRSSGGLR